MLYQRKHVIDQQIANARANVDQNHYIYIYIYIYNTQYFF